MNHRNYMRLKNKKSLTSVEKELETRVAEIANSSFGDVSVLIELKNLLSTINHCNEYKMYYVRDLAIDRAIRRCDYEIDFSQNPCAEGEEEKFSESLKKKHGL